MNNAINQFLQAFSTTACSIMGWLFGALAGAFLAILGASWMVHHGIKWAWELGGLVK